MVVHSLTYEVANIFTTTFSAVRRRMADAIFKKNPLAAYLLMRGRVEILDGGRDILRPVNYAKNPNVKSYSGYDVFAVTPSDEATMAQYQWKLVGGTVSVSGEESEVKNSGAQAVFNLVAFKVETLERTIREELNVELIREASLKSSTEFLGLDNLIEQNGFGTVGGINGSTNPWWKNQVSNGALASLIGDLRTMYNNCTKGGERPDLILTSQTVFERYEQEMISGTNTGSTLAGPTGGILRVTDRGVGDLSFDALRYRGATVMWDEQMENTAIRPNFGQSAYFINSSSLSLIIHARRNFVMKPFIEVADQDAMVAKVLLAGNLVANNRRNLGVIGSIT